MKLDLALRASFGILVGTLISAHAFAGGVDVSTDAIYSDDVDLSTEDGTPLDLNGDGNVDLAVASNRAGGPDASRYYSGNGDGTFDAPVLLATGASSEIAVGDVSGDLILDLVQGRRDLTDLYYLGNGTGVATGVDVSADTTRTLALALGDLDMDGDLDAVTGNGHMGGTASGPLQPNRFYLNDVIPGGSVAFTGADISADADDTRSIALADMDGDGDLDVVAGNDETTPGSNLVYLNQFFESGMSAVSFGAGIDFGDPDDQTGKLLIGDLDGDSDLDIVTLNFANAVSPGVNRFFINDLVPGGTFALGAAMDVSADAVSSSGGTLADFDGDGDLDIAVANLAATGTPQPRNRLYLNQVASAGGAVSFATGLDISADEHMSRELAAFDLNGDGHIDLVAGNQDQVDRRYLNNGTADPFTNVAPVVDAQTGPLTTEEETDLAITLTDVTVTDPDNVFPNDFTLTVQAGANYTAAGNTITPAADFDGDLAVPVIVNDGTDDSAAFDLTVTVTNIDDGGPSFTSVPVIAASVGVAYTYSITTTDPDAGDVLTISATTLPSWLTLTDNGDRTATLAGTPAAGDGGPNSVALLVQDPTGASAMQNFTITVAGGAGGNTPPSFSSAPVTAATVGAAYSYSVTASDADAGDTLTITAAGALPGWLTLTDNGDGSATLSGTPADGDLGPNDVSLQVTDGTATAVQNFTVTVADTPADTTPPVITLNGPATLSVTVNSVYNDQGATATDDVDGDLTASIVTDNNVDTSRIGSYTVTYDVSDAAGNAAATVTRTVNVSAPVRGDAGGGALGILPLLALFGFIAVRKRPRIR